MINENSNKTSKTLQKNKKPSLFTRLLRRNKSKIENYSNANLELEIQKILLHYSPKKESSNREFTQHYSNHPNQNLNENLYKYLSKHKQHMSSGDLSKSNWYSTVVAASRSLNSGLNKEISAELANKIKDDIKYFSSENNSVPSNLSRLSQNEDDNFCRMCLSILPLEEMYRLSNCECKFCIMCMQQYLTINILEGNIKFSCPDPFCNNTGSINDQEIEKLIGSEIFQKYKQFKLNAEIDEDPSRCWCPKPECNNICQVQLSDVPVPIVCSNCNTMFCSSCKELWHSTQLCKEKKCFNYNKKASSFVIKNEINIKHCPGCNIPIERNEGCAQMKCRYCKHIFCWHCLSLLDDDVLLRHFDKGPCKNKLGHTRASLIWHRIRVVITIIGLSALLATLSPLLLVSLPFLLC
ncbi:probable E3 ubiquitin-protein ligase RNF144A-A isoform X2 [Centruroides vittatus]